MVHEALDDGAWFTGAGGTGATVGDVAAAVCLEDMKWAHNEARELQL